MHLATTAVGTARALEGEGGGDMVEGLVGSRQLAPRHLLVDEALDDRPLGSLGRLNHEVGVELKRIKARPKTSL